MNEPAHSNAIYLADRFPTTHRAIENLADSVLRANIGDLEDELITLRDSLIHALTGDEFISSDSTPRTLDTYEELSQRVPEADIPALAIAFAEAPRLRAHHAPILLAILTDIANQTRATLARTTACVRRPLELTSLSARAKIYYEAFQSVWRDSLRLRLSSSMVKDVKHNDSFTDDQKFALRFLVFARVAQEDLETEANNRVRLKAKIIELIQKDADAHRDAIAVFFPNMQSLKRGSFRSTAKRRVNDDKSDWWQQLEKLL